MQTYLAASARETTKSILSASEDEESLMTIMLVNGLLDFRCIKRSIATLVPSTGSARELFWPADLMASTTLGQPDHALLVIPMSGTPALLEPKVTKPMRSRPPRD